MLTWTQRSGSQEAVFDKFKESIFSDLHVATIGVVTALDSITGLPTVKPIINERIVQSDGTITWQEYPEIPDTPYIGNAPSVGSSVLLIFCDHDLSSWLSSAGTDTSGTPTPQNQEILRSHSLSNAVAITGLVTSSTASSAITYASITDASTANNGTGVSDALVKFIERYEGCVLDWYDDGYGNQTIGYGHTGSLPAGYTAPLTQATAESLLQYDLTSRIASVQSIFSDHTLTQNQFDALVDFVFNLGSGNLSGSTLAANIKAGASSEVLKVGFEAYCHANGKVVAGLVKRRDAEWAMFCNNQYLT
jgi:lysozyme